MHYRELLTSLHLFCRNHSVCSTQNEDTEKERRLYVRFQYLCSIKFLISFYLDISPGRAKKASLISVQRKEIDLSRHVSEYNTFTNTNNSRLANRTNETNHARNKPKRAANSIQRETRAFHVKVELTRAKKFSFCSVQFALYSALRYHWPFTTSYYRLYWVMKYYIGYATLLRQTALSSTSSYDKTYGGVCSYSSHV